MDVIQINHKAVIVLLLFIFLDIITGVIKGAINKELSSSVMRMGLLKKLLEIIAVIVAFACDFLLGMSYIGNTILFCFCGMEGLSIVENIGNYISIPDGLKQMLKLFSEGKTPIDTDKTENK